MAPVGSALSATLGGPRSARRVCRHPSSGQRGRPRGWNEGCTWFSSWVRTSRSGTPSASMSGTWSRGLRTDTFPPKLLGWLHRVSPKTKHRARVLPWKQTCVCSRLAPTGTCQQHHFGAARPPPFFSSCFQCLADADPPPQMGRAWPPCHPLGSRMLPLPRAQDENESAALWMDPGTAGPGLTASDPSTICPHPFLVGFFSS